MNESARATADSHGRFSLPVADLTATHVVRVVHQGITYHKDAEPALKALMVVVYDVAPKVSAVNAIMDVQRFEAAGEQLEVKQLITMRNSSQPPLTLMNDRPFEIQLPPEAEVQSGLVQVEDGPPLKQRPVAGAQKGQYYFAFPIRPGDTRFAVVYRIPYKGEALIKPRIRNAREKFVVMLPKSMRFEPKEVGTFHSMPGTTPDKVLGTDMVEPEQTVAFRIAGLGMLQEFEGRRQESKASAKEPTTRPGGGLGAPIEAPDPLQKCRWPILAGLTMLMAIGAGCEFRKAEIRHRGKEPPVVQAPARGVKLTRSRSERRPRRTVRV